MGFSLILVIGKYKLCNDGLFVLKHITKGNLSRHTWVPVFKKKYIPPVVRSKEDLKAEGDRVMGIVGKRKIPDP